MFSAAGIGISLASSTDFESVLIQILALIQLTSFSGSSKIMFYYKQPMYLLFSIAILFSVGACTQAGVLNILIGIASVQAGIIYFPSLIIVIVSQLVYGFLLHRRGTLAQKQEKDIDLGHADADILSNYIKIV